MNKIFNNKEILILCILIINVSCTKISNKPKFHKISVNNERIQKFEKFEIEINLEAKFNNPYDYDQICVSSLFYSPSGRIDTVEGFYCKNFFFKKNNPWPVSNGTYSWKIRFTPNEVGKWKYKIICKDLKGSSTSRKLSFDCIESRNSGFLRKTKGNYLQFDNKDPFFAVGLNIAWWINHPINDFTRWIDSCSANGINYLRVWVTSWGFAFEWNDTQLKNYDLRQDRAYYLDWLIEYARSKNIYIQLCLNNHGQLSTVHDPEWDKNPYNKLNNGICEKPIDFFINNEAKKIFKNKLRYTIARYGYSPGIAGWELFNEINNIDDYHAHFKEINSWIKEITTFIKQHDNNKHLVSISYNSEIFEPEVWKMSTIDFTQLHYYINFDELEDIVYNGVQEYLKTYNKPVLDAEFGLSSKNIDLLQIDSSGCHIHNIIWGTSFSGSIGCGMSWWWYNYIDPGMLFKIYKPLSCFMGGIDFSKNNFKPYKPVCKTNLKSDLLIGPAYSNFGKSPEHIFTINPDASINPNTSKMARYIYGNDWNIKYRSPLYFSIDIKQKKKFKIFTSFFISEEPILLVKLNDNELIRKQCDVNNIFTIDLPEGLNELVIDNKGKDWIEIKQFSLENYTSAMKSYALKADSSIIGWIHNKFYNHGNIKIGATYEVIKDGRLSFNNMINGKYKVEWFDCSKGLFFKNEFYNVQNKVLEIQCPEIKWDLAYKITCMQ